MPALPLKIPLLNTHFTAHTNRPNLGRSGQPERFIANAVPKAIVPPRPVSVFSAVSSTGLSGKREAPPLTLRPLQGALWTVAFPTPVNATTDERNDDMKPAKFTNKAELKALFDHAVRAIGFYEAQRKEALMALESLRRALGTVLQSRPRLDHRHASPRSLIGTTRSFSARHISWHFNLAAMIEEQALCHRANAPLWNP